MGPEALGFVGRPISKHTIKGILAEEDSQEHESRLLRHGGPAFRWLEGSAILGKPNHEGSRRMRERCFGRGGEVYLRR